MSFLISFTKSDIGSRRMNRVAPDFTSHLSPLKYCTSCCESLAREPAAISLAVRVSIATLKSSHMRYNTPPSHVAVGLHLHLHLTMPETFDHFRAPCSLLTSTLLSSLSLILFQTLAHVLSLLTNQSHSGAVLSNYNYFKQ